MAIDLGKQIGPMPLGAWIAVVGVGLGIAWYTRNTGKEPTIVEDTSGTPGVGVGGSGQWVGTTPPTTDSPVNKTPTTNEEWAQKAAQWLIAMGYPSAMSQQAVSKYVTGVKLSAQEYTLIALALVAVGPLPGGQPLPPEEGSEMLTATYEGGEALGPWLLTVNAQNLGVNLTKDKLLALNPGLDIRKANFYGWMNEANTSPPGGDAFYSPSNTVRIR